MGKRKKDRDRESKAKLNLGKKCKVAFRILKKPIFAIDRVKRRKTIC